MAGRPWRAPARHWEDRAHVIAGLDELGGGSWFGINDDGLVAGVMNRPHSLGPADGFRSRGELPLEALDHATAKDAAEALAHLDGGAYRPFNLVVADAGEAFWLRSDGDGIVEPRPIPTGLSVITAQNLNDTTSPRIAAYRPRFAAATAPDPDKGDWSAWEALLASRDGADSEPRNAMAIVTDMGFGTVSSSEVALPAFDRFGVKPVFRFAAGRPGEAPHQPVSLSSK